MQQWEYQETSNRLCAHPRIDVATHMNEQAVKDWGLVCVAIHQALMKHLYWKRPVGDA
jgi:hypothetical protein